MMPLEVLLRDFRKLTPGNPDPWIIATQLGIPPDGSYLLDGLRRSIPILEDAGTHLRDALRIVLGPRLEPDELLTQVRELEAWVSNQQFPHDSPFLRVMARDNQDERHPLAGYCLSTLFHWPNLFYELPNQLSDDQVRPDRYRNLLQAFSAHVIAAQSTVLPVEYRSFCTQWWRDDLLPDRALYPDRRLMGRTAAASRVIRRITTPDYKDLLDQLTWTADPYHVALQRWDYLGTGDLEQQAVRTLSRFLHSIVPGWRKPIAIETRDNSGSSSRRSRVVHQTFGDGFIRISASQTILTTEVTDAGIEYESFLPRPPTAAELTERLVNQYREELDVSSIDTEAEVEEHVLVKEEAVAAISQQAEAEALRQLDGHQWLPAAERLDGNGFGTVLLASSPDSSASASKSAVGGTPTGGTIRWAQDHRRRFHYAHRLTVDRINSEDCRRLLEVIAKEPVEADGAVLMALHVSIALGRPFETACRLRIHDELDANWAEEEELGYVLSTRQWRFRAPPPAFEDHPYTASERRRSDRIYLDDQTGFFDLAKRHNQAGTRLPIVRLTASRRANAAQWLKRTLPDRDIALSALPAFLFHEVLYRSDGDLGIATMLTSRTHGHSASVSHYACYPHSRLQQVYRLACRRLRPQSKAQPRFPAVAPAVEMHGARRVPTIEAVRDLIAESKRQLLVTDGLVRHNHYTAYTWIGCVLGLGMRPLTQPHLHELAEVVGSLPVLSFIDKARSDYHRRLAVVPEPLVPHINRYVKYFVDLRLAHPEIETSFWFIDPETRISEPFRPSHFQFLYKDIFDLELYSLRRFVRTELMALREVNGETLDAFMGHWNDGVSPHDSLSTFPFRLLHQFARTHVTALLKNVEFVPRWFDHGRK